MRVLMTGATGNVGRLVVGRLLSAGVTVRALSRDTCRARFAEDVEVFQGDLARPPSLAGAMEGVDRMYLFPHPATAPRVVSLAKQAGVRRIVVLSSGAVTTGPSIRAERVVREPLPDLAWYPVHERDIADVAAAALLEDGHEGAAYTLNGPDLITRRAQVAAIAAAIGQDVRLDVVTSAQAREQHLAQGGFAAENADFLTGFEDYSGEEPSAAEEFAPAMLGPMPTTAEATGQPARTFAEWASDHAPDFT